MYAHVMVHVTERVLTLFYSVHHAAHAQLWCDICPTKARQIPQWCCGLDAAVFPQEYCGQMSQNKHFKNLFLT
jgi:hypothetical protein